MRSFCPAPFKLIRKNNRDYQLCCESPKIHAFDNYRSWWNSAELNDVRNKMVNGEYINECKNCYLREDRGDHSLRDTLLHEFGNRDASVSIESVDVSLGNLCNLKCIMCNAASSSQIQNEWKNNINNTEYIPFIKSNQLDMPEANLDDVWNDLLNRTSIRHIKLLGGEPLIHPEFNEYIKNIPLNQAKNIKLEIITNGTKDIKNIKKYLEKFKELIIIVSLEGYKELNDYIRTGSKWDEIITNITEFKKLKNCYVSINTTTQATNILYMHKLINWSIENTVVLNFLYIKDVPYLDLNATPQKLLKKSADNLKQIKLISKKHNHPNIERLWKIYYNSINKLIERIEDTVHNNDQYRNFISYINVLDKTRGTNFLNVVPEWKEYWKL